MQKHNGHSSGHVSSHAHRVPSSMLQTPPGEHTDPALATMPRGVERNDGQQDMGHSPRHQDPLLFEWLGRHAGDHPYLDPKAEALMAYGGVERWVPGTRYRGPARAWRHATAELASLSRIVLQPTVLKSIPIGDNGEQAIGLHVREGGVMVQVEPWSPMQVGDRLQLFWGAPDDPQSPGYPGTPAADKTLQFPEELNKAVLLSVPEEDVVAGWFNVVCRVTRATTGYQELSPRLRVLVKLDRPGGIDPAPDVNPNLAAPGLPAEVIRDGVDTSWAARGVPVTIQPYPNMAVGDRIRLS
ncbi:hypothetical protein EO087_02425 [Dyella sp. M7H15-1]|uniref:hypothetical protein n=1 Tax=Dyella sp. M7H15-1 TaxID=2501295 RepID=UPI001004E349|nr:hypothetical protein [Dyella sp. M7H15-1]QAU22984.1 hypothetical protein EO087_02425 [Dyella sp. M7H15-1]